MWDKAMHVYIMHRINCNIDCVLVSCVFNNVSYWLAEALTITIHQVRPSYCKKLYQSAKNHALRQKILDALFNQWKVLITLRHVIILNIKSATQVHVHCNITDIQILYIITDKMKDFITTYNNSLNNLITKQN